MEKQFRHKKTGEIAYYKDGIFKQGRFAVEIGVEPSKEYWEEVTSKKEWEILETDLGFFEGYGKHVVKGECTSGTILKIKTNGVYAMCFCYRFLK